MILTSNHSAATWIFPQQENKLRSVLENMTMINSVEIQEYTNPTRQELKIEISDTYLETPDEIFKLGMLVQTCLI